MNATLELLASPVQKDWIASGLEKETAVTTIPITRMMTQTKNKKMP